MQSPPTPPPTCHPSHPNFSFIFSLTLSVSRSFTRFSPRSHTDVLCVLPALLPPSPPCLPLSVVPAFNHSLLPSPIPLLFHMERHQL